MIIKKKIRKSENREMHFGFGRHRGFKPANIEDIENVLTNLNDMKLWRCTVCNDLYVGINSPRKCPTCFSNNAYVEIDEKEFRNVLEALSG